MGHNTFYQMTSGDIIRDFGCKMEAYFVLTAINYTKNSRFHNITKQ